MLQTDISGTCEVTYNKLKGMLEKAKKNCKTPDVFTKYNTVNQVSNCNKNKNTSFAPKSSVTKLRVYYFALMQINAK